MKSSWRCDCQSVWGAIWEQPNGRRALDWDSWTRGEPSKCPRLLIVQVKRGLKLFEQGSNYLKSVLSAAQSRLPCSAMLHLYPNNKWSWDFRYRNLSQLDGLPSSNTSHFTNTTRKGENKYKYKDLTKAPNVVIMLNNKWSRSFPLQRFRVATRICLQHDKKFHRNNESLMESNAFKHQFQRECRNIIYQSNRMLFCLSSHELSLLLILSFSLSQCEYYIMRVMQGQMNEYVSNTKQ